MSSRRILVVAAHPDDEILGMGGTIAKHALHEGAEVTVLWVSEGSSAQYPGDHQIAERKFAEAEAAAKLLGVSRCIQSGLPDMRLDTLPHIEVNKPIESAVREIRPDTVYTVHPDVNVDHRTVFRSVMVATRPYSTSVRRILTYATTSGVEWTPPFESSFAPTWFSNISSTIDAKVAAFDCYTTETRPWPHPRSARAIRATAESWGTWAGWECAEPFVLVRELSD
ncbi:PIG-L deacetylase family protein [Sinosporangium siamense]|uniref:PIG-L domain-containing protein n=1 Tax=Sinosporangium siamense TaxID=1367973 RepID=A0A919VC69_9ACTN|nr:PIG-L deacetylase family protein [Sinosporangium siamense]GII92839.1 PIG-L domain-containing protein [Sinosporangium siamense]